MQWDWAKSEIEFIKFYHGGFGAWLRAKKQEKPIASIEITQSIPVLLYHGVIDDSDWEPDEVNISFANFKKHMFALKKAGYETITLNDYIAFSKGEKDLPEKSFLLTFDDGRKDSFFGADPVLRTVDYTAVMYVITGRSLDISDQKSPFHLSKLELEKMIESSRWQIGSHTQNGHGDIIIGPDGEKGHFMSNLMWKEEDKRFETKKEYIERIEQDLKNSKSEIKNVLGVKGISFAYPFGDFGQASENFPASREILPKLVDPIFPLSFRQAGNNQYPINYSEGPSLSKRINIDSNISAKDLLAILESNEEKPLDDKIYYIKDTDWQKSWGDIEAIDNALFVGNSEWEDSAMTFLGGSYLWKNYEVQASASVIKGNNFSISTRFKDENNYASCEYSDTRAVLFQRSDGIEKPFIEKDLFTNIVGRKTDVSMRAQNNWAGCYLDGNLIVSGNLDNNLDHGGLGFKVWDSTGKGVIIKLENLIIKKLP